MLNWCHTTGLISFKLCRCSDAYKLAEDYRGYCQTSGIQAIQTELDNLNQKYEFAKKSFGATLIAIGNEMTKMEYSREKDKQTITELKSYITQLEKGEDSIKTIRKAADDEVHNTIPSNQPKPDQRKNNNHKTEKNKTPLSKNNQSLNSTEKVAQLIKQFSPLLTDRMTKTAPSFEREASDDDCVIEIDIS